MLWKLYDDREAPYRLHMANGLWTLAGHPTHTTFTDTLRDYYGTDLHSADFASDPRGAERAINQWGEQRTAGRIDELLTPGSVDPVWTRLVLVNAVYFQGEWHDEFERADTESESFARAEGGAVSAPMMKQKDYFPYHAENEWHAIELDYKSRRVSMVVFLPRGDHDLSVIESRLGDAALWSWLENTSLREVDLWLPRFTFRSRFDLNKPLQAMGMVDAFGDAAKFGRITSAEEPLFVSDSVHEAWLKVDEEGTEAAAAAEMMKEASDAAVDMSVPVVFHVDRPCVFAIRHKGTGAILFLGRLGDPSKL